MRAIQAVLVAMTLALSTLPLAAADAVPISAPDKYAAQFVDTLFNKSSTEAAEMVATSIGRPKDEVLAALKLFDGKHLNFGKTVIDKEFNGALRQIVYYAFIDGAGFIYFRFNFKMTKAGWILAYFTYKSETNELFPKDFVDR